MAFLFRRKSSAGARRSSLLEEGGESPTGIGSTASLHKKDFAEMLHEALRRTMDGNPRTDGIVWEAVAPVLDCLKPEARPSNTTVDDILSAFKGFIKSEISATSMRALLILDYCFRQADHSLHLALGSKKWINRFSKIATTSLDPDVRFILAQLLVDWVEHLNQYPEMGAPFLLLCQALRAKRMLVPPPSLQNRPPGQTPELPRMSQHQMHGAAVHPGFQQHPSYSQHPNPDAAMQAAQMSALTAAQQRQFQEYQQAMHQQQHQQLQQHPQEAHMDSIEDQTRAIEQQTNSYTEQQVAAMLGDIQMLDLGIQAGGKLTATEGDEIWDAAERCVRWANVIEDLLVQDISEALLAKVLDGNDMLNLVLRKWNASGEVADDSPAASPSPSPITSQPLIDLNAPTSVPQAQSNTAMDAADTLASQLVDASDPFAGTGIDPFGGPPPPVSTNPFDTYPAVPAPVAGGTEAQSALQEAAAQQLASAEARASQAAAHAQQLAQQLSDLEQQKLVLETEYTKKEQQIRAEMEARLAEAAARAEESRAGSIDQAQQDLTDAQTAADSAVAAKTELEKRLADTSAQLLGVQTQLAQAKTSCRELEMKVLQAEGKLASAEAEMKKAAAEVAAAQQARSRNAELEKRLGSIHLELKKESVLRKKAVNELRELKGNIRVCARVRPPVLAGTSGDGAGEDVACALRVQDEFTLLLDTGGGDGFNERRYEYDTCFGPATTQEEVYSEVGELLQSALDGYNVGIFCYGQTGSGKTHTMLGQKGSEGVLPRAMVDLFKGHAGLEGSLAVKCYMLELYQENLIDLLKEGKDDKEKLAIKKDATGTVWVDGATVLDAANSEALEGHLQKGLGRRHTASTNMNSASSRSHLIFSILVQNTTKLTGATTNGKVTFVDLAGSERVNRSGAISDEKRLAEAKAINKSLSALGDVVAALTASESFIPYRNHKLTQLMQDSLGGNAKCCMIVNVSPLQIDADESRNSLDYAARVKQVTNDASKSVETQQTAKLKATIDKQAAEIARLKCSKRTLSLN